MEKKFIVTPKKDTTSITIRIKHEDNEKLEEVVLASGRSRNEIINMAIRFALDNLEFTDLDENKNRPTV